MSTLCFRQRLHLGLWVGLLTLIPDRLTAHAGPEHEIAELTEEILFFGATGDRLLQRAIEYRTLGRLSEAEKDLKQAVTVQPSQLGIRRELARVQYGLGLTKEALQSVESGLRISENDPDERASLLMLRGELQVSDGKREKALSDFDAAIQLHPENADWFLLRSGLQRLLGKHEARLAGLKEGIRRTGSGMLEIERTEALLDAGLWALALKQIQPELEASRLKASWQIRRARALIGLKRRAEAETDLRLAVTEIELRLGPGLKEASLLADRGFAYELLGQTKEALHNYIAAMDAGSGLEVQTRLKALQAASTPHP
ncbi:MAG: tetratricopeptide repeat protein [Pedosphaera sp.]|nr:tetratricopeptide repeat protein [Pedosphaera sp.]